MGPSDDRCSNCAGCALGVGQRLGVIAQQMKRHTEHPVRYRKSDRVGRTFGNRLGSATESKGTLVVFYTSAKNSQTGKSSHLIVDVPKAICKLTGSHQRRACVAAPTPSFHERVAKG